MSIDKDRPSAYSFIGLPFDILLQIARGLTTVDILALRKTCRVLNEFTRARSVWHDMFTTQVLEASLPAPGLGARKVESLSAEQLECLTRRALGLRENWMSANPVVMRHVELSPSGIPSVCNARNLATYFLPGRENRCVLTVAFYDQPKEPRKYVIHCWDVLPEQPRCVGILRCIKLVGALVNSDPENPGVLAVTLRRESEELDLETYIYSIDFTAQHTYSAFSLIRQFPGYRHPIALEGSVYIASGTDNIVRLVDIGTGDLQCLLHVPLEHGDPTLRNEGHRCSALLLVERYALSFCKEWIHLYSLPEPSCRSSSISDGRLDPVTCNPIASHRWQWRIDSLVVSPRHHSRLRRESYSFPMIDILIRFDTWFPWPVNILHHYVLHPNPGFANQTSAQADINGTQPTLPYLSSNVQAHPLVMVNSIPSPVRLFTPSDMVLGQYGTAIWLDAQSLDSGPAQAGDRGQRIAGKVLTTPGLSTKPGTVQGDDRVSPGFVETGSAEVMAAHRASTYNDKPPSNGACTMVFHIQSEDDGWSRLALDEEEGRIAIGNVYGKVSLYEYAPREYVPL